ncbi:MAG: hypothetical protein JKX90_02630 [Colwellia sp.]|jgi:uncharacterized membrane protein|nr:hypothetical protein [Colwellia sp.]
MPTNKHKRKASAHAKPKKAKSPGLITLHPKAFILVGLLFVVISLYLLTFQAQDNAMFGLAMLSLIAGVVLVIYAKIAVTKKNNIKGHV